MAEIVNLRAKRKAAERDARRRKGDENAAKFGRTKAERDLQEARAEKARDHLDAHRRESGREPGPEPE
ncbi:DUF4169 family protein [Cereibacter azotoformans]|uniref:Uncharacterized protein DUF4169 n=1 Tax=Cereibacter azotoformans TaxID=43057 RepID=A0A2T5K6L9_9RHOB|nr:DUF4169 family protein [Cereibacter azotoformans]AXQ92937.1 DUF4169 family protein [Cereibacter sphaeroides]MBO4169387.1 DUF4169 family protein [Cereibacter azotoformans]PTR18064.1 uncharacterized protein DUF4169 [Cereibacter azotoformans]UIJ31227.1 DUF4169 family protein [Cereibacter azotoformans]